MSLRFRVLARRVPSKRVLSHRPRLRLGLIATRAPACRAVRGFRRTMRVEVEPVDPERDALDPRAQRRKRALDHGDTKASRASAAISHAVAKVPILRMHDLSAPRVLWCSPSHLLTASLWTVGAASCSRSSSTRARAL